MHIAQRQKAFLEWHSEFFAGVQCHDAQTTCGPYVTRDFGDFQLGILPINTTTFCVADDDCGQLWIGRRCLDKLLDAPWKRADLTIALMHHPLDWLHEIERTQITSKLYQNVDCILRGHLHQTELTRTDGTSGSALHLAAGASYQGTLWPNKAMFVEVYDEHLRVVPIKFEDLPSPVWTIDSSVYPDNLDFSAQLRWRRANAVAEPHMDVDDVDQDAPPMPLWDRSATSIRREAPEDAARRVFEQDLFVSPRGNLLVAYCVVPGSSRSSVGNPLEA